MNRLRPFCLLALTLILFAAVAEAQAAAPPPDLQARLNQTYAGREVPLRNFYKGKKLEYDCHGNVIGTPRAGSWRDNGLFQIHAVQVTGSEVTLIGVRPEIRFVDGRLVDWQPADWKSLTIGVQRCGDNDAVLFAALAKVFIAPDEDFGALVSDADRKYVTAWRQQLVKGPQMTRVDSGAGVAGAYRVGSGASAPRLLQKRDPHYSEEARHAHLQGTVLLSVVVGTDSAAHNIKVLRSLGRGLDEEAIAAVKQWRFQPGMKDGIPVPVEVAIEINFHL